jgi:hypothetical protein
MIQETVLTFEQYNETFFFILHSLSERNQSEIFVETSYSCCMQELCSAILKDAPFRELHLFPSSDEGVGETYPVVSVRNN